VNDSINDRISTQNTLTISGTQNFQFNLTNGGLGAGIYTLIDGGNNTVLNSPVFTHNLPATTRQSFALTSSAAAGNPAFVQLAVTGNSESLVWTGAAGNAWNLNTTANWTGTTGTFFNLDAVTFNDSSGVGTVTLTGTLQPKEITVSNNTTAYTFGGSGSMIGSAALTKSGTGTLAINTANTYTRGTTVNGGTVSIGTATALGSGFVALNGSTLQLGERNPQHRQLHPRHHQRQQHVDGYPVRQRVARISSPRWRLDDLARKHRRLLRQPLAHRQRRHLAFQSGQRRRMGQCQCRIQRRHPSHQQPRHHRCHRHPRRSQRLRGIATPRQ
jgi:autotransporter-associated beta strand protein